MENKKVFIDAAGSQVYYIFLYVPFYLLVFVPTFRSLSKGINNFGLSIMYDRLFLIFLLLLVILPIVLLLITLFLQFKMYNREIITDDAGVTFKGLFKIKNVKWNEIISLDTHNKIFLGFIRFTVNKIKMAEVKDSKGKYYFPLSMKENGLKYPEFSWYHGLIDKSGNKITEISPEDCPLYVEIQRHLVNK